MRTRLHIYITMVASLLCGLLTLSQTYAKKPMSAAEILQALKPGQWVKVEGIIQGDSSVLCKEVKFLTGDFLEDDWKLAGVTHQVDPVNRQLRIAGPLIKLRGDAEFENDGGTGPFKGFDDVKPGMRLDVEGTYLKDGTFFAKQIQNGSARLASEPGLENEIKVRGKVGDVDLATRSVTLMGITFKITDRTKGKSAIR
jgi:hypothetical protein